MADARHFEHRADDIRILPDNFGELTRDDMLRRMADIARESEDRRRKELDPLAGVEIDYNGEKRTILYTETKIDLKGEKLFKVQTKGLRYFIGLWVNVRGEVQKPKLDSGEEILDMYPEVKNKSGHTVVQLYPKDNAWQFAVIDPAQAAVVLRFSNDSGTPWPEDMQNICDLGNNSDEFKCTEKLKKAVLQKLDGKKSEYLGFEIVDVKEQGPSGEEGVATLYEVTLQGGRKILVEIPD